jgi:hypothetical protein
VLLPPSVFAGLAAASPSDGGQDRHAHLRVTDRLNLKPFADITSTIGFLQDSGIPISEIPPMTAGYFEIKPEL